LLIVL